MSIGNTRTSAAPPMPQYTRSEWVGTSLRWRPTIEPSRPMNSSVLNRVRLPGWSDSSLSPTTQFTPALAAAWQSASVSSDGMRTAWRCMAAHSSVDWRTETAPRQDG